MSLKLSVYCLSELLLYPNIKEIQYWKCEVSSGLVKEFSC